MHYIDVIIGYTRSCMLHLNLVLEYCTCHWITYTVLTSVGGNSGSKGRNRGSRGYIVTQQHGQGAPQVTGPSQDGRPALL